MGEVFRETFETLDEWAMDPTSSWEIAYDPDIEIGVANKVAHSLLSGSLVREFPGFGGDEIAGFEVRFRRGDDGSDAGSAAALRDAGGGLIAGIHFDPVIGRVYCPIPGDTADVCAFAADAWRAAVVTLDQEAWTYIVEIDGTEYGPFACRYQAPPVDFYLASGHSAAECYFDDAAVLTSLPDPVPTPAPEDEYAGQFLDLAPIGAAWPRDSRSVLARLLDGMGREFARVDARVTDFLRECDPAQANELLPEWEDFLGLPDACAQSDLGYPDRIARLLAAIAPRGGQSPDYFIAFAAAAGVIITIHEYREDVFRCGIGRCGDALTNESWMFVWEVTFYQAISALTREIECRIRRRGPAHAYVFFSYPS